MQGSCPRRHEPEVARQQRQRRQPAVAQEAHPAVHFGQRLQPSLCIEQAGRIGEGDARRLGQHAAGLALDRQELALRVVGEGRLDRRPVQKQGANLGGRARRVAGFKGRLAGIGFGLVGDDEAGDAGRVYRPGHPAICGSCDFGFQAMRLWPGIT